MPFYSRANICKPQPLDPRLYSLSSFLPHLYDSDSSSNQMWPCHLVHPTVNLPGKLWRASSFSRMPLCLVACSSFLDFQTSLTILIISGKSQGSGPCWHPGRLPREEGSTPSGAVHLLPSSAEWKYRSSTGILPCAPEEEVGPPPPPSPPLPARLLLAEGKFFPGRGSRAPARSSPALERQASSSLAQPPVSPVPAQTLATRARHFPRFLTGEKLLLYSFLRDRMHFFFPFPFSLRH